MSITELNFDEDNCDDATLVCSHHLETKDQAKEGNSTNNHQHVEYVEPVPKAVDLNANNIPVNTDDAVVGDDDDFGFEEYKDTKLIKIGKRVEEVIGEDK